MNRRQFNKEWSPTRNRETWSDYLWYCLLFGTVGSALVGAVTSGAAHKFFLYTAVIGMGIMAALFAGLVLYTVLRFVIHRRSGGV